MSRALSVARSNFELANVALEDVILEELNGRSTVCDHILQYLEASVNGVVQAQNCATDLHQQMKDEHFADLPSLRSIDFEGLGSILASRGMVCRDTFEQVARTAQVGGFYAVLGSIHDGIKGLYTRTLELQKAIPALWRLAPGKVHHILEENLPGNIKVVFAQLYTDWSLFNQYFLASAMCSTEQWYVYMSYPSLTGSAPILLPVSRESLQQAMR